MRQKARQLAREINMPGFRRARHLTMSFLRRVGKDSLRADVIDDMVPRSI
jgi:FKBP-type peptidyl-prolyl cis-trans isomerase (trigger factor)